MTKKTNDFGVCSECIDEFQHKDLFTCEIVDGWGRNYYTIYCKKCMIKIGIKKYRPYTSNCFTKSELLVKDIDNKLVEKKSTKNKTTINKKTKSNKNI